MDKKYINKKIIRKLKAKREKEEEGLIRTN